MLHSFFKSVYFYINPPKSNQPITLYNYKKKLEIRNPNSLPCRHPPFQSRLLHTSEKIETLTLVKQTCSNLTPQVSSQSLSIHIPKIPLNPSKKRSQICSQISHQKSSPTSSQLPLRAIVISKCVCKPPSPIFLDPPLPQLY